MEEEVYRITTVTPRQNATAKGGRTRIGSLQSVQQVVSAIKRDYMYLLRIPGSHSKSYEERVKAELDGLRIERMTGVFVDVTEEFVGAPNGED